MNDATAAAFGEAGGKGYKFKRVDISLFQVVSVLV